MDHDLPSSSHPGLIPNDVILIVSIISLVIFVIYEVYYSKSHRRRKDQLDHLPKHDIKSSSSSMTMNAVPYSRRHIMIPQPVYEGMPQSAHIIMDPASLSRYIPKKLVIYQDINDADHEYSISEESKDALEGTPQQPVESKVIGLPHVPGCELTSHSVSRMQADFPLATKADMVRFLVARKGNLEASSDMYRKAAGWHMKNLPLRASPDILRAIDAKCLFSHGVDRDGAPVIYLRGALYDSTKASPETYVMLAAHAIDWALRRSEHCAITCLVHSAAIPGAPNEGSDVTFIKGFVQTLSDNFPERLKRLAIYPFPWYGRAIWAMVRVFVDKRTQDKVLLVPHSGKGLPPEICAIVDPSQIPICCGGTDTRDVIDLASTLLQPHDMISASSTQIVSVDDDADETVVIESSSVPTTME